MNEKPDKGLLPEDALSGVRLGISVSESADLARLGLREAHFRLVLAEVTRYVLLAGGHLAYGGHLEPTGYTAFMIHELERYSRRDRPLRICLSFSEHRALTLERLAAEEKALGLYGSTVYLDADGNETKADMDRGNAPPAPMDADTTARSLTGLRRYMAANTQGRVFLGGKRAGFQGEMPGLLEEAIISLEQGHPIYLAAGLGGVTYDIARALGVNNGKWLPEIAGAPKPDNRLTNGLTHLTEAAKASEGRSLNNGLTAEENRRLGACHRPSEIAALISLGLGRFFSPS